MASRLYIPTKVVSGFPAIGKSFIAKKFPTMVRDLAKMEEVYNISKIQPVDMFPFTKHVECVAVLNLVFLNY